MVFVIIPPIIKITSKSKMFDEPSESRKVHKKLVPNSGGIAVFIGFLFSCLIFIPYNLLPQANVLMATAMLVFITGLTDDIDAINPLKKFISQFLAALMVSILADLRIVSLYGILDIYELSYNVSVVFTVFSFVGVVNAFNLIDGIDGLAGALGVILTVVYCYLFFKVGQLGYAYLSISLAGALIGFLYFNITPAKIFMGDSGSLLLGFIAAVLSIRIMENDIMNKLMLGDLQLNAGAGVVAAILVIPVFDTLRVFAMRIYKGTSPFTADNNHLHHRLLALGLSHIKATSILVLVNVLFILMSILLQEIGNTRLIGLITLCALTINGFISLLLIRRNRKLSLHK